MISTSLPFEWKLLTLRDVASEKPNAIVDGPFGSNLKTDDYVEHGIPVLQGKNITNDTFKWFDVRFISEQKAEELKRSSVRSNDILLVKIGSIGYSAIVNSLNGYDFAIIPANLVKITPNSKIVCTKYLHRWLTSPDSKRYLIANASKTAQPALSLGKIKELPVPLPPLQEQHRIVTILDQADALRAKRREALVQIEYLTQSIFMDLFGDPITNPKKWPHVSFEEFFSDQTSACRKLASTEYCEKGLFPVVDQGKKFIAGFCDDEALLSDIELPVTVFGDHTRIIKHIDFPFVVGADGAKVLKAKSGINQRFATHLLQALPIPDLGYSRHMKEVKRLKFVVPPEELQFSFEKSMEAVDKEKLCHIKFLEQSDALFSSLQYLAFRGEV